MTIPKSHRKRVRHFDKRGEIHELTFSCYQRRQLLENDWRREQLSQAIDRAMRNHHWRLTAFVYMPEHVHLLVYPVAKDPKIKDLLFAIKRPFSFRVKQRMIELNDPLADQLSIRQRPGKATFRFWQEGPGYDRNIWSAKALHAAIDYIHMNPVRRGLVDRVVDYRWSSARWYHSDGRLEDPLLPTLSAVPLDWFGGSADVTSY